MRRIEQNNRNVGMSIPTAAMMIVAISALVASSAVIIAVDDEIIQDPESTGLKQFHLEAEPPHQNGTVKEAVEFEIHLCPHIYLYAPCYLKVLDLYDGVVSSIEPDVIYPDEVAILTLYSNVEGDFHRDIVGIFHGSKDVVRVTVTFKDDKPDENTGEFDLVADPESQSTHVNTPAVYQLTIDPSEEFKGYVDLEVLDMFDGVISTIFPDRITLGETAYLTLTPMIAGEFHRDIVASNDDFEVTIKVLLDVHARDCYET